MRAAASLLFIAILAAPAQTPDWSKVNPEAMRHFQALIQIDSTDPPGNETRVVDYVRKVFDAEGIPYIVAAKDPARAAAATSTGAARSMTSPTSWPP